MPKGKASETDEEIEEEELDEEEVEEEDPLDGGRLDEDDDSPKDTSKLLSALKKERADRKKAAKDLKAIRADLKALQDEKKKREEADLSDADKAKSEAATLKVKNDELAKKLRTQAIRTAVLLEAGALGFVKPVQAYRLLDEEDLADLEVSEDGEVEGVAELVKGLAKENKHLLKAKKSDGDEDDDGDEEDPLDGDKLGRKKAPEMGGEKGGRVTRPDKKALLEKQVETLRGSGNYAG